MRDLPAPDAEDGMPAEWARSIVDPVAFAAEQKSLAHVWTLLGLAQDVERDGDWIRASLATRSVFVQRFGGELKGFENVCAHRFYPLRTAEKGNGPIVCGFHNWRYDKDGRALGIPMCEEMFGVVSRTLDARLAPVEIATCGGFVFGRFPAPHATQSLEDYLGDCFPILATFSRWRTKPQSWSLVIKANWRPSMHISMDDYHLAAVHPATFGREGKYLKRSELTYVRVGLHNAYMASAREGVFEQYVANCRKGAPKGSSYNILKILPNFVMAHARIIRSFYVCVPHQFIPLAHDRTLMRMWIYPAPFSGRLSWLARVTRPVTDPIQRYFTARAVRRIFREDAVVCERLQETARLVDRPPRLGALEERIAWFEESYRKLLRQ